MKKKVVVDDRMQQGYVYWRTEPVGRHFAPASTRRIRAGGSSGTAATTWAGEAPTMCGRVDDGARLDGTWRPFGRTANEAISSAGGSSGRPCCIGRTTAEGFRKDFNMRLFISQYRGDVSRLRCGVS